MSFDTEEHSHRDYEKKDDNKAYFTVLYEAEAKEEYEI